MKKAVSARANAPLPNASPLAGPGNDVVTADPTNTPGVFDGGGGVGTLVVFDEVDLRTSTVTSFERLAFSRGPSWFATATFSSDQLGGGLSNTLQVSGIDHADSSALGVYLEVWAAVTNSSINISGWTFTNWSGVATIARGIMRITGDVVTLNGNSGANTITGSRAADFISGGSGGADRLNGGAGNDFLSGFTGGDEINGGSGLDVASYRNSSARVQVNLTTGAAVGGDAVGDVLTSIEGLAGSAFNDVLTGSAAANDLFGLAGVDKINGGAGADRIAGGDGRDNLTGGAGADRFIYDDVPIAADRDKITDFTSEDRIVFDHFEFTQLGATVGKLGAAKFYVGAAAHDATDRVIYNDVTGALLYDPDGNGATANVLIATLSPGLALTNANILVV